MKTFVPIAFNFSFSVRLHRKASWVYPLVGDLGQRGRVQPFGFFRSFSSSPASFQTRKELLAQIDWDRQSSKLYVIVDPLDPEGLLYLSEKEYHRERLVAISNDVTLEVLARPGSKRPTPETHSTDDTSPNSPPLFLRFYERFSRKSLNGSCRALFPNFSEEGMVSLHRGNTVDLFRRWGLTLLFWAGYPVSRARCYRLIAVASRVDKMRAKYGTSGLVMRLKVSLVVVLQYLSSNPVKDTRPLGLTLRLSHGLPAWLPHSLRVEVRRRNLTWIRIVLSILNSYKAIKCKGVGTFSTITAPSFREMGNDQGLLDEFTNFSSKFWDSIPCKDRGFNGAEYVDYPFVTKAGPNHPLSFVDAAYCLLAYAKHPQTFEVLVDLMKLQGMAKMAQFVTKMMENLSWYGLVMQRPPLLGKLATKVEAAGKIRVFAIVDYWTQRVSQPWHDLFFKILKSIPEVDGTFDQDGLVAKMVARGFKTAYSYDLKSATDLIPLELYHALCSERFDQPFSKWLNFIVDREFREPLTKATRSDFSDQGWDEHLMHRYTRGQPMGCLGSWASLALVHHALVRFAMFRTNLDITLPLYGVLGDDIVIFDPRVAEEYKRICEAFGIPIGLPKSFVSPSLEGRQAYLAKVMGAWVSDETVLGTVAKMAPALFNFANQTFMEGVCLSVISLKEELACATPFMRIEMANRLVTRGWTDGTFAKQSRLLMTRWGWVKASPLLSKGLLPRSMRAHLRLALSPAVKYYQIDKAAKLWLWFKVSLPRYHFLSAAGALLDGPKGPKKKGLFRLEGYEFITRLSPKQRSTLARAIYALLWALRDTIIEIPGARQQQYNALRDVQAMMPRSIKGLFHFLTGSQRPSSLFDIRRKEVRWPPEDDDKSPDANFARFLPKLDSFLEEFTFLTKAPFIWMTFVAGMALWETGVQVLKEYGPLPAWDRLLEVYSHWHDRGKEVTSARFIKENVSPSRKQRTIDLRSKEILRILRSWDLSLGEVGLLPLLKKRDAKPTTSEGVVPAGYGFLLNEKKK